MGRVQQFIAELKRRRVIRALLVWGVVAFAVLQVYEPVMHGLHLPEWTLSFVVVVLEIAPIRWTPSLCRQWLAAPVSLDLVGRLVAVV